MVYHAVTFHNPKCICQSIMLWHAHNTLRLKTWLIRIHIISQIQWMLALVVAFTALPS